ncbi:primosome, DnaD subunit [Caldalkalibacillus thermarum TA2.A1]|uniref:DnaD domain-containing protein n=1 Tax=Caldalkalibacillus thermarum (strain TA2.A1) TaxID=986075 RepID=F5L8V0_CALTT|nr:DnaD domain-containing protein [Caldalkalibacillus thermarum]EGL82232.1 primosome, DnaD subunit [Caldalkalibacillus thermarum TA2.A1]QZT32752.1 DnaD domain-containing protein [Caldalkalibacillus thermarum TA2.A1]GGK24519.1 DNA replication protein DnaD [Caldalkalibacillus thermarum]
MISVQDWAKWMNKGSASIPHLLLENYKKLHLSDTEMMLLIHIHSFVSEGISFPSIKQLEERMTCSQVELTRMLNRLRKERFLEIRSNLDENNRVVEHYSLEPLWEKLFRYLTINVEEVAAAKDRDVWPAEHHPDSSKDAEGRVFKRFEQEFGRPLSPMECETIATWLDEDQLDPQIILLALKEAVIANKRSLRYIDKILLEWQKNGLTTVDQVLNHIKGFRRHQASKSGQRGYNEAVDFPFYNWLER